MTDWRIVEAGKGEGADAGDRSAPTTCTPACHLYDVGAVHFTRRAAPA